MTLNYEEEGEVKLPVDCEGLAKEVIEAALDYAECPYEAEVNLLLTTDVLIVRQMYFLFRWLNTKKQDNLIFWKISMTAFIRRPENCCLGIL